MFESSLECPGKFWRRLGKFRNSTLLEKNGTVSQGSLSDFDLSGCNKNECVFCFAKLNQKLKYLVEPKLTSK